MKTPIIGEALPTTLKNAAFSSTSDLATSPVNYKPDIKPRRDERGYVPKASFVLDETEEAEAKALIAGIVPGLFRPAGPRVLIRVYVRPNHSWIDDTGKKRELFIPESTKETDAYTSQVALVVDLGAEAYCDKKITPGEPWCKVGDWVIVRRYDSAALVKFRGQWYGIVNDDQILGTTQGPDGFER